MNATPSSSSAPLAWPAPFRVALQSKPRLASICACLLFVVAGFCFSGRTCAWGQSANGIVILSSVTASNPLPSGIEIKSGDAIVQITALRDDVVRVRIDARGSLPEDASWAVLDEARNQRVNVIPESDANSVGFRTQSLRVTVERATLRLTIADKEGHILQQDAAGRPVEFHGNEFRLYKAMPPDEHYFGLGDKPGPLDRREHAFTLWNTDEGFQESTDPIYKSIPFFQSVREGRAIGVLLDNTWRSSFDFGKESRDAYSFGAQDGPLNYYVLYGPTPKQVLEDYAWLTGKIPLPPRWSLGYQQSRYSYYPESRVREVAARLRADKIPADVIWLDIDYQKNNRPFTVDEQRFPHFTQMIQDLKRENLHVVTITDLHVAYLPNAGYAPYDSGSAGDHFVKNADGSLFIGKVWPGPSVFPDFTRKASRDWWGTLYREFYGEGIAGFWNDMNEPSVFDVPSKTMPDDAQHRIDEPGFVPRAATHLEIHNVFGMQNTRGTFEGLKALKPNQRPFVMTRASYAGGQRYAVTWTGDNSSTWNHLRISTPMLENLGLSGFAMAGADVGGFGGTPQPDLLTKWIEIGAFQPIDRNHTTYGSGDQEPWVHGPEHEAIRRRFIEERYRLLPYLYTTVEETSRTGLPIVRPLFLEFPAATPDHHPLDLDADSEFLFGPDLLVAPPPNPDELDDYEVVLPPVIWFDYWTGEKIRLTPRRDAAPAWAQGIYKDKTLIVHPTLAALPVYVREGAILPIQPLTQSTDETPKGPLTLRVFPGHDCKGSLYSDDGQTLNFQKGEFLRVDFHCEADGARLHVGIGKHEGSYQAWWKDVRVEICGQSSAQGFSAKASQAVPMTYDDSHHAVAFTVPDSGQGVEIEVQAPAGQEWQ